MEERTNDDFNNDCLFDLDLLEQMCSGLDGDMQDKLDLELFVKSSNKPPQQRELCEHEPITSNNDQEDVSLSSCRLSHASLLDLELFVKFSDEAPPNNDQESISLSSYELSHASLPAFESNIDDCLFWNALLNASPNHDPNDDVLIHEKKEKSSKALRFPELLWTILGEEQHPSLISWRNDGRTFVIHDQSQFEAIVMPLYFQTTEWRSFQKQLNIYGFRKVNRQRRVYYHQYFMKDEPISMALIKREKVYPRRKRGSSS